jgi:tetratricopeptide (TPR) repeat protein
MKRLKLPDAPANQTGPVKAWTEPVVIPTYHPLPPDKNPMFLEKRVYQGSSGRVYPLPFTDRIATDAAEHTWQAVHLENEFLRVMVLPEIGGRIHIGVDKTNGYDFFYRQNVIKPALVGLAGPWISGGVEFNWPQHHRPATFMPVRFQIEEHADGSRTIWCSDHDPMNRLKGMHGICLHPEKAYIELKVRLYNRTPLIQTFLWWANIGVQVHELYQSFFPPDVHFVADHAKRAKSSFPLCDGYYYGVNYGERGRKSVPAEEQPLKFVPPGSYPPNDLRWYANIAVPTSYMAIGSSEDFHGGYDHKHKAGLVLVANHHIAPGKKQWTWGNHPFGYAWDRNLTDEDGPYIELMAGVYTDNQPDFSFLAPGETKTFSQYWYPIREIGPAYQANRDVALSFQVSTREARIGVCATQTFPAAKVRLESATGQIAEWQCDLKPGSAFLQVAELPAGIEESELSAVVESREGQTLLRYTPAPPAKEEAPPAATEPGPPEEIRSNDELYVTGLHLDQYRHATRHADVYWREALRRDPADSRCNNAMGSWHLRRAEFARAEKFFRQAIQTLTLRNPNPWEGEGFYNLGLTLRYLSRDEEAYAAFYKAAWNSAWRSAAYLALAELDAKRGDWNASIEHLESSLRMNTENLNARNLSVVVLHKLGRGAEANRLLKETLTLDPLDSWACYLASNSLPSGNQMLFDLALDYTRAGLYLEAIELLGRTDRNARDGSVPILLYALGHIYLQLGNTAAAKRTHSEASIAPPDYCFPNRLEEFVVLQEAVSANPEDARAAYYLGNLLYDRRRHREAIALWERAARRDSSFSTVWRNLGISYFNVLGDEELARSAFDKAIQANPGDARILYERDQLWKRLGESPERRLTDLEKCSELVGFRDDLSVELASLYNQTRQYERALSLLASRKFQPWEGGEGLALGQYVRANLALGRRALANGDSREARHLFEAALRCPENLGEAAHLLANQSDVYYLLGSAFEAEGDHASARQWFERSARHTGDFQEISVKSFSEMSYYNALALKQLGRAREAEELLRSLLDYAKALAGQVARIDYFATSLPTMLLFEDDLQKRDTVTATFLRAQAWLGLGDSVKARELLHEVMVLDRNHSHAADMLAVLEDARGLESGLRSSVDTNTRLHT